LLKNSTWICDLGGSVLGVIQKFNFLFIQMTYLDFKKQKKGMVIRNSKLN